MKKKIRISIPVWVLLLIAVLVIAAVLLFTLGSSNKDQALLTELTEQNVASVTINHALYPSQTLTDAETADLLSLLSQVELPGDPWDLSFIGGTEQYTILLKDGRKIQFSMIVTTSYYYGFNGRYYYLGKDAQQLPDTYRKLDALYNTQCARHFSAEAASGL